MQSTVFYCPAKCVKRKISLRKMGSVKMRPNTYFFMLHYVLLHDARLNHYSRVELHFLRRLRLQAGISALLEH